MADEPTVIPEADVPPAPPADVTPPAPPAEVPPAPEADVPPAPADEPGAEGAADKPGGTEPAFVDQGTPTGDAPPADASRTGFAEKGQHQGDECICPDGRKGTVHSFDAGLICIPNHDQG